MTTAMYSKARAALSRLTNPLPPEQIPFILERRKVSSLDEIIEDIARWIFTIAYVSTKTHASALTKELQNGHLNEKELSLFLSVNQLESVAEGIFELDKVIRKLDLINKYKRQLNSEKNDLLAVDDPEDINLIHNLECHDILTARSKELAEELKAKLLEIDREKFKS